jgi:hypothetical protein
MSKPKTIQECYYHIIKSLYGDAIVFTPKDVSKEVIKIVDVMLDQIMKCHNKVKPIALIFQALAIYIKSKYPPEIELLVGSKSWLEYTQNGDGSNTLINMAKVLKEGGFEGEIPSYADLFQKGYNYYNLFGAFYDFYEVYLDYNSKDRRMLMCINTTKLYWRSPLQLALMGY